MTDKNTDVVIIGGGIVGIATAYFLGKAGVKSLVVERDAVGSHASGFAYGGLGHLAGAGIPGPLFAVAEDGMNLHRDFSVSLPEQTGVNIEYRPWPSLRLAFSEEQARDAKAALPWQAQQDGASVRWVEAEEVRSMEPRISDKVVGAVHTEGSADVEPYRLVLALTQAAENMGATIRHGTAIGLKRQGERVTGVILESGEVPCEAVVLAMGPWSGESSSWLGVPIQVGPLKGQILRLRAPGPPIRYALYWTGNYATTKPDGLVWTGTTEEEVGFDENPSTEARDGMMAALLQVIPSMVDAQLVHQTACLRPLSADDALVLGKIPGWDGVYIATGAGRKGILLGPSMGRITADLVTKGASDVPIDAFDPGRFAKVEIAGC